MYYNTIAVNFVYVSFYYGNIANNINTCIIMYYYVVNGVVITNSVDAVEYKKSK